MKEIVIRNASVAGLFYPENKTTLLDFMKKAFSQTTGLTKNSRAIIVPHAGYIYSGYIAAKGFRQLQDGDDRHVILIIGPSHRVPINGPVLSDADFFETPLGKIPVNRNICDKLLDRTDIEINSEAHQYEHSIEVQLPFLQYIFGDKFEIVPVLINQASPSLVNHIVEEIWDSISNIIISSDLSHYLNYNEAIAKDNKTCDRIESLDYRSLQYDDACGLAGVNGLLLTLEKKQLKLKCVDKCNSGDTGSEKSSVVGYASFCTV